MPQHCVDYGTHTLLDELMESQRDKMARVWEQQRAASCSIASVTQMPGSWLLVLTTIVHQRQQLYNNHVSHDISGCSCMLVTTSVDVRACQSRHQWMFVHVSHDIRGCSCILVTTSEDVRACQSRHQWMFVHVSHNIRGCSCKSHDILSEYDRASQSRQLFELVRACQSRYTLEV